MFTTTKYIHDSCFNKINITEIKEDWFNTRREIDEIQTLEAELEELYDEISLKRKSSSSSSSNSSNSEDEVDNEKQNQYEQLKTKIKKLKGTSFNLREAVTCNFLPNANSDVMEDNIVVGFDKPAIYSNDTPLLFQVVKIRAVYIVTSVEQNNHYLPVTLEKLWVSKEKVHEEASTEFVDDLPDTAVIPDCFQNVCLLLTNTGISSSKVKQLLLDNNVSSEKVSKIKGVIRYIAPKSGEKSDGSGPPVSPYSNSSVTASRLDPASGLSIGPSVTRTTSTFFNVDKHEAKLQARRVAYLLAGGSKIACTEFFGPLFDMEKYKEQEHQKLFSNSLGETVDPTFSKIAIMSDYKHSHMLLMGQVVSQADQTHWSIKNTRGKMLCVSSFFTPTATGQPFLPSYVNDTSLQTQYHIFFENIIAVIKGLYSENAMKTCSTAQRGFKYFSESIRALKDPFDARDAETSIKAVLPVRLYEHVTKWLAAYLNELKIPSKFLPTTPPTSSTIENISIDDWEDVTKRLTAVNNKYFGAEAIYFVSCVSI